MQNALIIAPSLREKYAEIHWKLVNEVTACPDKNLVTAIQKKSALIVSEACKRLDSGWDPRARPYVESTPKQMENLRIENELFERYEQCFKSICSTNDKKAPTYDPTVAKYMVDNLAELVEKYSSN